MNTPPEIQWLVERWNLPASAIPEVRKWLDAEANGSTACNVNLPADGWGDAASPADSQRPSPLLLVRHEGATFLQSRRLYHAEHGIAARLRALAVRTSPMGDLSNLLQTLFPDPAESADQIEATRIALTRDLAVITGGPGSGKTHTLARILALLVNEGLRPQEIRLAAPTGKAADRMKKAVVASLASLPPDLAARTEDLAVVAGLSTTIHALLGYHPDSGSCRFNRDNPLPCSVVILDECSMIDVHLWSALLNALPESARLILLGDPNQLESVGQGNVFSDLVAAACQPACPLHKAHVHLTKSRRFQNRPGIASLAEALEKSDVDRAIATLRDADAGLEWTPVSSGRLSFNELPAEIRANLAAVARAGSPQEAHEALNAVCVLTAQREFFVGAKAMSRAIEAALGADPLTRNQPIIINRNDPETGLRNGSVGILHRDEDGRQHAWFPSANGTLTACPLSRLPEFSPAWAITIHRSQGSEFDNVAVILPRDDSPLATRELLYTAITRARKNVFLFGDEPTIRKAVTSQSPRTSLLAAKLLAGS